MFLPLSYNYYAYYFAILHVYISHNCNHNVYNTFFYFSVSNCNLKLIISLLSELSNDLRRYSWERSYNLQSIVSRVPGSQVLSTYPPQTSLLLFDPHILHPNIMRNLQFSPLYTCRLSGSIFFCWLAPICLSRLS